MTEGWVDYLNGPWGFAFAFAAGILSFLSPCVLPLVPAYLAHLTGTTALFDDDRAERRRTVVHAISFVLGFTAVFTLIGASVGLLGALFGEEHGFIIRDHQRLLAEIGGVFLIVLGLNLLGVIRVPWLFRTYTLETATAGMPGGASSVRLPAGAVAHGRPGPAGSATVRTGLSYARSFGVGSAFAIGWTPCIGPVLGAIIGLAASTTDVARGAYLLFVYSLGLGVPFVITGLAVGPISAYLRRMRGLMPLVEIACAAIVIFVGILLFTDNMTIFNRYFSDIPFLDRFNTI